MVKVPVPPVPVPPELKIADKPVFRIVQWLPEPEERLWIRFLRGCATIAAIVAVGAVVLVFAAAAERAARACEEKGGVLVSSKCVKEIK